MSSLFSGWSCGGRVGASKSLPSILVTPPPCKMEVYVESGSRSPGSSSPCRFVLPAVTFASPSSSPSLCGSPANFDYAAPSPPAYATQRVLQHASVLVGSESSVSSASSRSSSSSSSASSSSSSSGPSSRSGSPASSLSARSCAEEEAAREIGPAANSFVSSGSASPHAPPPAGPALLAQRAAAEETPSPRPSSIHSFAVHFFSRLLLALVFICGISTSAATAAVTLVLPGTFLSNFLYEKCIATAGNDGEFKFCTKFTFPAFLQFTIAIAVAGVLTWGTAAVAGATAFAKSRRLPGGGLSIPGLPMLILSSVFCLISALVSFASIFVLMSWRSEGEFCHSFFEQRFGSYCVYDMRVFGAPAAYPVYEVSTLAMGLHAAAVPLLLAAGILFAVVAFKERRALHKSEAAKSFLAPPQDSELTQHRSAPPPSRTTGGTSNRHTAALSKEGTTKAVHTSRNGDRPEDYDRSARASKDSNARAVANLRAAAARRDGAGGDAPVVVAIGHDGRLPRSSKSSMRTSQSDRFGDRGPAASQSEERFRHTPRRAGGSSSRRNDLEAADDAHEDRRSASTRSGRGRMATAAAAGMDSRQQHALADAAKRTVHTPGSSRMHSRTPKPLPQEQLETTLMPRDQSNRNFNGQDAAYPARHPKPAAAAHAQLANATRQRTAAELRT
eukprot:GHVT01080127.1.p1 GENE.GHVT01080127.1~~GHVT01080127.1.p1  ORF type:complete len:673 (-),score=180.74 GHVT01080127.1:390-2408(-)